MRSISSRQFIATLMQSLASHTLPSDSRNSRLCLTSTPPRSAFTWQSKRTLHKVCIGTRTWQFQSGWMSTCDHLTSCLLPTSTTCRHSSISTKVTASSYHQSMCLTMRDAKWISTGTSTLSRSNAHQWKRLGRELSAWLTWPMIWPDIFSSNLPPVPCLKTHSSTSQSIKPMSCSATRSSNKTSMWKLLSQSKRCNLIRAWFQPRKMLVHSNTVLDSNPSSLTRNIYSCPSKITRKLIN